MRSVRAAIDEPTPRGIAAGIARLIRSGELAPGDRLPTVRVLAAELGVSPATVSTAWQTLTAAGLIVSRGRSGSTVRSAPQNWMPTRYRGLDGGVAAALDLSQGTPDPTLLPRLDRAYTEVLAARDDGLADASAGYRRRPDIPELHDLLREGWPSRVETLTVVDGALDGIDRALASLVHFGDRAVVETPTFPPLLDLLERYGVEPIGVPLDEDGMHPGAFGAALASGPAVVFLQPRAHNPTGISMSTERAGALAEVLRRSRAAERAVVIEDDHSGGISSAEPVSLAAHLPARVLHVRSFSKSHGPDLRIGALGGPRALVDRVVARRLLGPGWTSRITQAVLHRLLTDPVSVAEVDAAREAYAARQRDFAAAMTAAGVPMTAGDGINAWVPVADERAAIVRLAAAGIRVAPGAPFQLGGDPHVRVTVGAIVGDARPVAAAIAEAARA